MQTASPEADTDSLEWVQFMDDTPKPCSTKVAPCDREAVWVTRWHTECSHGPALVYYCEPHMNLQLSIEGFRGKAIPRICGNMLGAADPSCPGRYWMLYREKLKP